MNILKSLTAKIFFVVFALFINTQANAADVPTVDSLLTPEILERLQLYVRDKDHPDISKFIEDAKKGRYEMLLYGREKHLKDEAFKIGVEVNFFIIAFISMCDKYPEAEVSARQHFKMAAILCQHIMQIYSK